MVTLGDAKHPSDGDYATHKGDYRGNWPPQLVRNLLLRYSEPGDTILDQMVGSGTTLVECKLLHRNAIGVDINLQSIMLTHDRLDFKLPVTLNQFGSPEPKIKTYVGEAITEWVIYNHGRRASPPTHG